MIAPAIKATSPDPSRRTSPAVLVYIIQPKKDLYLGSRTASIDRAKRIAFRPKSVVPAFFRRSLSTVVIRYIHEIVPKGVRIARR